MNTKIIAKAKENWFRLIICLFLLIIALAQLKSCQNKRKYYDDKLKSFNNHQIQVFNSKKTRDSIEIVNQRILIATEKEAIESGKLEITEEIRKFKKILAQIKVSNTYNYPTTVINYGDTNSVVTIDTTDYLKLPQNIKYTTDWVKIRANISKQGLKFDTLSFRSQSTITIGKVKNGFMKPYLPELVISNSNPYTKTDTLNSIVLQDNLKWHQKPINTFGLGAGLTLLILTTLRLLTP